MPTTGIKAATQIAIGVESTPGQSVSRTRRLLTRNATYRLIDDQEQFEEHMHGTLARAQETPVTVRTGSELELPLDFDFEQILFPLLAGVKGDVTPTMPGSGEARLWTFEPVPTAAVDPKTYSLEWVESNFAGTPDNAPLLALYAFVTAFQVEGRDQGVPTVTVSVVARKSASTTKTTIALPTLTRSPNPRWKIYFDDAWADLGTTQITGQIYGFTFRFSDYLRPEYYLDGRSDGDFVTHEFAPRMADLTLDVVHNTASGKLVPAEDAKKASKSLRFVRGQIDGAAFDAPDNGLNRFFRFDGSYQHAPDSMQDRGGDRNGNIVTRLHLQSFYDPTAARDVRLAVQNNLASFP